mmetsp:Transcript_70546/g.210367  ORF Transcript_70546/g.210367 Transcript_70546/m.210367 type:complete len:323 (-) Transcript_70546:201-1169(-)
MQQARQILRHDVEEKGHGQEAAPQLVDLHRRALPELYCPTDAGGLEVLERHQQGLQSIYLANSQLALCQAHQLLLKPAHSSKGKEDCQEDQPVQDRQRLGPVDRMWRGEVDLVHPEPDRDPVQSRGQAQRPEPGPHDWRELGREGADPRVELSVAGKQMAPVTLGTPGGRPHLIHEGPEGDAGLLPCHQRGEHGADQPRGREHQHHAGHRSESHIPWVRLPAWPVVPQKHAPVQRLHHRQEEAGRDKCRSPSPRPRCACLAVPPRRHQPFAPGPSMVPDASSVQQHGHCEHVQNHEAEGLQSTYHRADLAMEPAPVPGPGAR